MTWLYYDPRLLEHDTGRHPERPERLIQAARHLDRTGLDKKCQRPEWESASPERMLRAHEHTYLEELEEICNAGGGRLDQDTVASPKSLDVARLAAGAVCDATDRVLTSAHDVTAFCLIRPPGHHALADRAMGFCLLGHVAIAAHLALAEHGLERVLIVDWDVHHGNGTQDMFYSDPRVGYFSIHRWPFYPGTGSAAETGAGEGAGMTRNVPVEMGTPRAEYLARFRDELADFAALVRPQLVLISAGFDTHSQDPVGSLGLETEDFVPLTQMVLDVARDYAHGRVVSALEGGYNPGVLAGCVEVHLRCLLDASAANVSG